MPDLSKVLRLVEEGALSPDEAEEILAHLEAAVSASRSAGSGPPSGPPRQLRVEISDKGRRVVNLRVPMNVATFAAGIVPGLPDEEAERLREAIRSGARGPIVDITSEDGDRVLIVSE
ncbi:MAG TPA: hypothetical protein VM305_01065 [Candidatus Limnocylindrales bacterium]|nr:hypothetical protein [Candidatus Limnocylindrales bacterium]